MTNEYYNYTRDLTPGTKVRSEEIDEEYTAIAEAFDKLADPNRLNVGANIGGEDTGTANNYVVNNGGPTTLVDLQIITFAPGNTNTGPSVIDVNGAGNVTIVRNDGTPLQPGDLIAGVPTMAVYDQTNNRWVIIGATAQQARESSRPGVKTVSDTSYTLLASDEGFVIRFTSGSPVLVTVPAESTVNFAVGTIVHLHREGGGTLSVTNAGGVTIQASASQTARAQYSTLSVIKVGTNLWKLLGDMT
jgi:hypothetical protein